MASFFINLCLFHPTSVVAQTISIDELRANGALGFPVKSARTHCDNDDLRLQSWNDKEYLVVQAILWKDGDDKLGETSDGRKMGDSSSLLFDIENNQKRTPEIDRTYSLNPWPQKPGLRYTIPYKQMTSSSIQDDSKGHGSIRYISVSNERKVRVDTYAIPLSELTLEAGQTIGIAFLANSTVPKFTLNSIGYVGKGRPYYAFNLRPKNFEKISLTTCSGNYAITNIPRGRDVKVKEAIVKSLIKVGEVPPELIATDWLNTESPLSLAKLKGKVVLIDFWATWCGPCVAGIPHLNELHKKYKKEGLQVVTFTNQSRKGIENFLKKHEVLYPMGVGSSLDKEFGVTGIPHAFIIGRNGKLFWEGNPNDENFDKKIEVALSAPYQKDSTKTLTEFELKAGETSYINFSELGLTWRKLPAKVGVYLPKNYSLDKKYPLLVWFGGGAGTDYPKKPIAITEGDGFICVAVPYRNDGNGQAGGWQTPWSYYKTIFDKLETLVPNIDAERRVCGGFSSGGAAIMFQIGNSGEAFQKYFHAFIPGGAGWPMGGLESLKDRPMLAVMGEKDKRLPNYRKLEEAALDSGIDFKLSLIKDVAHGFPPAAYPEVKKWLIKNVVERKLHKK